MIGNRFRREEGIAIGAGDQFGATFGIRVGIVAAHRLVLAVPPDPLAVFNTYRS